MIRVEVQRRLRHCAGRRSDTTLTSRPGVYFGTDLPRVGRARSSRLQIPHEISGRGEREALTGRVATLHPNGFANGMSGWVCILHTRDRTPVGKSRRQEISEARSIQRDFSLKKKSRTPGYEIASASAIRPCCRGDISMFFVLTPMNWDFALPDVQAKDSRPALDVQPSGCVRGFAAPSLAQNFCVRLNALLHGYGGRSFVTFSTPSWDSSARR